MHKIRFYCVRNVFPRTSNKLRELVGKFYVSTVSLLKVMSLRFLEGDVPMFSEGDVPMFS